MLMIVWGSQYSFGVFLKPVLTEFGWTRSATAGAYSLNYILFGLFGIFSGRLSDRFGPRLVVTVSGVLIAGSYLLMSQISEIWQIYLIYGLMLSLGMAGTFVPIMSTVARWFIHTRGLASGIVSAGIGVGIVVMPPLANYLINTYRWRISYIVIGLIALTIPLILAQFLKREPDRAGQASETADSVDDEKPSLSTQGVPFRQALRMPQFWMISALFLVFNFSLQTVMVHLVPYATDTGISAAIAASIMSVIGIVSIISKVAMGHLLDRFRSKSLLTTIFIMALLSFLLLQLNNSTAAFFIFAVIFALGYGGYATQQSPTIAEYFGLKAHGSLLGLAISIASLGASSGPLVAGYIFDVTGNYRLDFILCSTGLLAGIIITLLLKSTNKNRQDKTNTDTMH